MDNEATKILSSNQNAEQKETQEKQKSASFVARSAATAAGAALGTSAAFAAEHIYEASVENTEEVTDDEVAIQDDVTNEVNAETNAQSTEINETGHTVVEHVVTVKVDTPQTSETDTIPEDGTYIDSETPEPNPTTVATEDEVHIVGVAVQDNGHGGVATLAGLQSGDDTVVVVDIESDGRLDYAIHDDNNNGQIDDGEIHDISTENISTANVIEDYVSEAHEQGTEAIVTDLDTGGHYQITEGESGYGLTSVDENIAGDNLYTSNDDMPDYMNDADTGIMDA